MTPQAIRYSGSRRASAERSPRSHAPMMVMMSRRKKMITAMIAPTWMIAVKAVTPWAFTRRPISRSTMVR